MTTDKNILVLYSSSDEPALVRQLAESITRLGSTAVVRTMHSGQYAEILDAVALADTVICWPPD